MKNKIIVVIALLIVVSISLQAQVLSRDTIPSDGSGAKKVLYSLPKKSSIKKFNSKTFSFSIDFAGEFETNLSENNFLGLKIPVTSIGFERYLDSSIVKIYEFPVEIKNTEETLKRFVYFLCNEQAAPLNIISVGNTKVSDFEAIDLIAKSDYELVYSRITVVGNKVFVLLSTVVNQAVKVPERQTDFKLETQRFLNSFSVAKLLPVQSFDLNWVKFVSEKGKFIILMPNTPKESTSEIPQDYGKSFINHTNTSTQSNYGLNRVFYTVSYSEMPVVITNKSFADVMYENSKQSALKRGKTLVAEKDFFYKDIKGKELITEDKDTVYHSRILLYQNKVYFVAMYFYKPLSAPQELYTHIADKYFDSFAIQE